MKFSRLALSTLILAACDVGTVPVGGGGGPDGSVPSGDAPSGAQCIQPATPGTGTHMADTHHVGQGCLAANCHDAGSGRALAIAGTMYKADGTTPAGGATVVVGTVQVVTGSNGNFYLSTPPTFPTTTRVSSCPSNLPMNSQLQATGGGDCNNCHHNGGLTTPMHL
jgi:hypothetical protein